MDSDPLSELKDKLTRLEVRLKQILEHHQRDLELAKKLQSFLLPSRTSEVPGIKSYARHLPGSDTSHDTFDIIVSKDQKELYLVAAWTPKYGLSYALLQVLFHLQSLALLQSRTDISLEELYKDILKSFTEFDSNSFFRLTLVKLDIHTLKLDLLFHNSHPLLLRQPNRNLFNEAEFLPHSHYEEIQPSQAFKYQSTLKPGSRFFYVGSAWNNAVNSETFFAPLQLTGMPKNGSLQEDITYLLRFAENSQKGRGPQEDITVVGFEVDSKKNPSCLSLAT